MSRGAVLLVAPPVGAEFVGRLRADFPKLTIPDWCGPDDDMAAAIAEARIVVGMPTEAAFPHAKRLELVQLLSAGVNGMMFPALAESPVVVCNGKGVWSPLMAEHALFLMLAFCRDVRGHFRLQAARDWAPEQLHCRPLAGATVGFIGTGDIAEKTAALLAPFQCRILGWNRSGAAPKGFDAVYTGADLARLMAESDFTVNTLPDTPATRGAVGPAELAAAKSGAVVINLGRGSTMDEPALVAALQSGRLGGAGLDVFDTEPLPPESPLWALDNVIISPHASPRGTDYFEAPYQAAKANIARFLEGAPLENIVDKRAGY